MSHSLRIGLSVHRLPNDAASLCWSEKGTRTNITTPRVCTLVLFHYLSAFLTSSKECKHHHILMYLQKPSLKGSLPVGGAMKTYNIIFFSSISMKALWEEMTFDSMLGLDKICFFLPILLFFCAQYLYPLCFLSYSFCFLL